MFIFLLQNLNTHTHTHTKSFKKIAAHALNNNNKKVAYNTFFSVGFHDNQLNDILRILSQELFQQKKRREIFIIKN